MKETNLKMKNMNEDNSRKEKSENAQFWKRTNLQKDKPAKEKSPKGQF